MQRLTTALVALFLAATATTASAAIDPIGDLLQTLQTARDAAASLPHQLMKATLYHGGGSMRARDSMGCRVSAMRTLAVDPHVIPRGSVVFIAETVGLPMPNGGVHDGLWYASDVGGAIKGERIDLFTGPGAASMKPLLALNTHALTVTPVKRFTGCPPV